MTQVHGEATLSIAPALAPTDASHELNGATPYFEPAAHWEFMRAAVESAFEGILSGEGGPFGAAVVRKGKLLCVVHNTVLKFHDCTNHAEMNAIREAARILGSHDLSDCELYTTCEPCPMCWGACNWGRIQTVYIGCNRVAAALYGFDDDFFYQELDLPKHKRTIKHVRGVLEEEVTKVLQQTPTYRRRMLCASGMLAKVYESMFGTDAESVDSMELEEDVRDGHLMIVEGKAEAQESSAAVGAAPLQTVSVTATGQKGGKPGVLQEQLEMTLPTADTSKVPSPRQGPREIKALNEFMQMAIDAALEGMGNGDSKEREPFGAVIVKDNKVIARACNTVLRERDPTATAEINAIRAACAALKSLTLDGCELYTTVEPDVMSLGAVYWSRISKLHVGVSQHLAALYGFEDGLLHYKDLAHDNKSRGCRCVYDIYSDECEKVFLKWKEMDGRIY